MQAQRQLNCLCGASGQRATRLPQRCRARHVHLRTVVTRAAVQEAPAQQRGRPGEKKGFVEEMRITAMKHHTREQAPREGSRPETENPTPRSSTPTHKGYLQFLAESKKVYDTLEQVVNEASHPEYARFQHTGLERSQRLATDIDWLQSQHSLSPPEVASSGPGSAYSQLLQELAKSDPAAFICHFYNFYFAHTAGGKMIGARVSSMLLDNAVLEFYKWDGDVKEMLSTVRDNLNEVAEGWTREQKDHCLQETTKSFEYSGGILRTIVETP